MIDMVNFLKSYHMVGQLHPSFKEEKGESIVALLVPVGTAITEYTEWSGQDITRTEFIKSLKEQGVLVFSSMEEFIKIRDNLKKIEKLIKKDKKKFKRNISEERKNELKEHAFLMRSKIRPSISENH